MIEDRSPTGVQHIAALWRRRSVGWIAPGDGWVMGIGTALMIGLLTSFWLLATRTGPDTWVPILIIVFALVTTIPLICRLTRAPYDRKLRWILIVALVLKLASSFARYYVNEVSYAGEADAGQYDDAGKVFVNNVHHGKFSIEGSKVDGLSDETHVVGYVTGILYLVVGTTFMGGFVAFAWVCFLGLLFFFQAFRISYPNAPPYLTAALLFFLPSMLYWPSSIGKDALMVFCIGAATYGIARLLAGKMRLLGIAVAAPAVALILGVRPHILMILLVGFAASLVARNAAGTKALGAAVTRVLVLILLVPMLLIGIGRMDTFFGTTDGGIQSTLDRTEKQTSIGGSAFETQPVTNPLDFPVATISVLYRPFIFEASGVAMISALEGTLLLGLTIVSARWIWRIGPAMYRSQFAAFCGGYVLAFVFAFSNIGNAGILARQRVQLFPIVILLAMAAKEHQRVHLESASAALAPVASIDDVPEKVLSTQP